VNPSKKEDEGSIKDDECYPGEVRQPKLRGIAAFQNRSRVTVASDRRSMCCCCNLSYSLVSTYTLESIFMTHLRRRFHCVGTWMLEDGGPPPLVVQCDHP